MEKRCPAWPWRRADSIFPRRGVIGPIATFRVGSQDRHSRHCHDACIAPDHGAQEQGGSRAPAQSPALRTLRRDAASGNGPAGAYAAWALLAAWAVPVGPDVLPESSRVENRTGGFPAGAECAALLLSGRHDKVSDRRAPWRHVACARLGKGRAGKRRDVPLKAAGGPKGTGLGPFFLVRKIPTRRACSSFRHAVGFTRHVDPGLRSSARNGCSRRHWVGFRVRSGSGLAFRCRMR